MKQRSGIIIKAISVLMAFCFSFSICFNNNFVFAVDGKYDEGYENMSSAQKQAYLTQHLKEVKAKLAELDKESEETQEYIDTLDEKIKYLKMELELAEENMEKAKQRIASLEQKYKANEQEIKQISTDINELTKQSETLQTEFNESYKDYAQRARALYISGSANTLETLLTSDDISTLFTRLEMIKCVSRNDRQILEKLKTDSSELFETKALLEDKEQNLKSDQEALTATKLELNDTLSQLKTKQVEYEAKEQAYETEKTRSDKLLTDLHEKTKAYSEYKNQDQKELIEVNREIEEAAQKFVEMMEEKEKTTTTTTTKPTTKKTTTTTTTTTAPTSEENITTTTTTAPKPTTTTTTKPTTAKTTTKASSKLNMTYPIPSQTRITTGYGSAGYAGHTGVDFACASGSKVVAVESGYVIISTDLKNSDGTYRSYGRYIVIAHDKKDSKGNYVYTLYAHNSSRVVSKGDYVEKGQLIAYSGSTGNSTGPHCHFEVRTPTASYDDCVDPTKYLP